MAEKQTWAMKGVWIPWDIWSSKALSVTERVMLTAIWGLDNESGCTASNAYFCEFFGLSSSRVSEIIHRLVKGGYVTMKLTRSIRDPGQGYVSTRVIKVIPGLFEAKSRLRKTESRPVLNSENRKPPSENRKPPSENRTLTSSENNEMNIPGSGLSLKKAPSRQRTPEEIELYVDKCRKIGFSSSVIDKMVASWARAD